MLYPFKLDNVPSFSTPQPLYTDGSLTPDGVASFHEILATRFDSQDAVALHLLHVRQTWSNNAQLSTAHTNLMDLTKSKDLPYTIGIVTFSSIPPSLLIESELLVVRSVPCNKAKDRPVVIGNYSIGFI